MKSIVDRYHHVGLRSNPFAIEHSHAFGDRAFVDRGLPEPSVGSSPRLVQVIGDKGAGKTSQLMAWRTRIPGPYHYVPPRPYRDRWVSPPVAPIVYGDEIDRMPAALLRSWFRRLVRVGSTLVIGTHVDLAGVARRSGLAVTTHLLGPVDLAFMTKVFDRRFEQVTIDDRSSIRLTNIELADIQRRSNGSLRIAELLGHEIVAHHVGESIADRKLPS